MRLPATRSILKSVGKLFLVLILFAFVFYLCIYLGFFGEIPSKKELKARQNHTASEVYSADGVLLGRYFIQDRTNVRYQDIAPHLIQALVATEDARFYEHHGVDFRSLMRVAVKTLLFRDESSGGGSTLSQQLAKNLYPRQAHGFLSMPVNKIKEMIVATRLESVYSKEEILELYLNTVPLGGNIYGIERASRLFFNKGASDVKIEEAAVLIGMLKANTTYNPVRNPEGSMQRRNVVLAQMAQYGYLSAKAKDSLARQPLVLYYQKSSPVASQASYFKEYLRQQLQEWCESQRNEHGEPYNLYTDGLKIYTTIDSRIQRQAEASVRNQMAALQKKFNQHWGNRKPWGNNTSVIDLALKQSERYKRLKDAGMSEAKIMETFNKPVPMKLFAWGGHIERTMSPLDSIAYFQRFLNTGLVAIQPRTGEVKAWVGGINHQVFKYDHVLSRRQAGSTFKPVVYAAALEQGIEPCQYFENRRISYPQFENWSPQNADNHYGGQYTMRGALSHSVNTVSAQLLLKTGIAQTINMARRMGIESDIPQVPSIALGTASLSLLELVNSYTTFVNKGKYVQPVFITSIKDSRGKVILESEKHVVKQAMSARNAAIMLELLKGVIEEGSAGRLRTTYGLRMDIAGKTGTTQNQADGWFVGITPDLVTGVWVGAEHPAVHFRNLREGQGASTALPVWAHFMLNLSKQQPFSAYGSSRFPQLSADLKARINCPAYIPDEEEVTEEEPKKESFIKRIFKKGIGLFKKKKKKEEPVEAQE